MARILLIESDIDQREYYSHVLGREGHEVDAVADVGAARELIAEREPDLIVLENVWSLATRPAATLESFVDGSKPPVILHTSHLGPQGIFQSLSRQYYVIKSSDSSSLLQTIHSVLAGRLEEPSV